MGQLGHDAASCVEDVDEEGVVGGFGVGLEEEEGA